jgi:hypothetical protein
MLNVGLYTLLSQLIICKFNLKWILQAESKNGQLDRHFFSFTRETDTDGACGKLKSLRIMLHEQRPFNNNVSLFLMDLDLNLIS